MDNNNRLDFNRHTIQLQKPTENIHAIGCIVVCHCDIDIGNLGVLKKPRSNATNQN